VRTQAEADQKREALEEKLAIFNKRSGASSKSALSGPPSTAAKTAAKLQERIQTLEEKLALAVREHAFEVEQYQQAKRFRDEEVAKYRDSLEQQKSAYQKSTFALRQQLSELGSKLESGRSSPIPANVY